MKTNELIENEHIDDIPTRAIDLIDDMLAGLPEEEQYGENAKILMYILSKLQEQLHIIPKSCMICT